MNFSEFQFKPFINKALQVLHFNETTPIQEVVIPFILKNKNVIGQSETGSGKTHAFLLPIFEKMVDPQNFVQAVITSPTRELAKQIYDMAQAINEHRDVPFKIKLYVGGTDREKELQWLDRNQPDMVIGTPGRVYDLAIKERKLLIHKATYFVVDEADMTLDSGFLEEIDQIAGTLPKNLVMCVFSATIPAGLKPFLMKYMERPEFINLAKSQITPKNLTHYLLKTKGKDKHPILVNLMKTLNPYLCLIFANTKKEVSELVDFLREEGYKVGQIHGDLTSRERARMMKDIRELVYTYVVATDIAARGIDIEGISHVINYELPDNPEFYIHRCGRTSRNNLSGVVYSFYDFNDDTYLNQLEQYQIKFHSVDVKNGEVVASKTRNARQKFMKDVVKKPKSTIPLSKTVKPNYKKKMK